MNSTASQLLDPSSTSGAITIGILITIVSVGLLKCFPWLLGPIRWLWNEAAIKKLIHSHNRSFRIFYNPDSGKSKLIAFSPDGKITEESNTNECYWQLKRGKLEILAEDKKVYSRFYYDKKSGRLVHTNDADTRSIQGQYIVPQWIKRTEDQETNNKETSIPESWSVKLKRHSAIILSITSTCIALVSMLISCKNQATTERLALLTITPELDIYIASTNDAAHAYIYNSGNIPAKNISVTHHTVMYPIKDDQPGGLLLHGQTVESDPHGKIWKFSDSLEVRKSFSGKVHLHGLNKPEVVRIGIHVFGLTYHHPADMRAIKEQVIFFDDGSTVYSETDYRTNAYYTNAINYLKKHFPLEQIEMTRELTRRLRSGIAID